MSGGNEITEGEYNSDNYDVTNRETDGYYAGLDKETSQGESEQTQSDAGSQKYQRRITVKRDSILNKVSFVSIDKDGNIFLDETIISPNHAIHEYTHLWDRAVQSSKDGMARPVLN